MRVVTIVSLGACALFGLGALVVAKTIMPGQTTAKAAPVAGSPVVVAKGQDLIAMRIREIAVANGVPILERKPLARALYKMCNVGQEIPVEFYSTVAEILAYVYELSGKVVQNRKKAS